uniref:Uncharacterized protein n=1 Tax=Salix viminalis TaxID=40686 RepID=A0A6N2M4Z3_SALVM
MVPAVASGLICGEGLWTLPEAVLALAQVKPPICMKFPSKCLLFHLIPAPNCNQLVTIDTCQDLTLATCIDCVYQTGCIKPCIQGFPRVSKKN